MRTIYAFGNSHLWSLTGPAGSDERVETISPDSAIQIIGWKLGGSGATAYGLLKQNSTTGAGTSIIRILDELPDDRKDLLLIFGEVDISSHIGLHGSSVEEEAASSVERYFQYISERLLPRTDVGSLLVASAMPHSRRYMGDRSDEIRSICERWNDLVRDGCLLVGATFVDWYGALVGPDGFVPDDLARNPSDPGECHLRDCAEVRDILMSTLQRQL